MAGDVITIGSDFSVRYFGARDGATGAYLNGGACTFALYTAAGGAVDGGTGTCAYVAGSDGNYLGTVESDAVALAAGASYYLLITFVQGGYNDVRRVDLTAQAPGGVIVDENVWMESTGLSVSGADLSAVRRHCLAVASALERKCYPHVLAPRALTLFPFDAPPDRSLWLPRPVRSVEAIYYRSNANGDPSALDPAVDRLVAGTDYVSRPTDVLTGWNRTGEVVRLNRSAWGWTYVRPPTFLAHRLEPEPGAVFVSASVGPASVDPAVQEAACRAVTLMFNSRQLGGLAQSQSWNGASFSLAAPVTADAAINSPEVTGLLRNAGVLPVHVG